MISITKMGFRKDFLDFWIKVKHKLKTTKLASSKVSNYIISPVLHLQFAKDFGLKRVSSKTAHLKAMI